MPRIWVSAGSNMERETHIASAVRALRERFGALVVSPVYETEAVGFSGDAFLNLVIGFDSEEPPAELHRALRDIEDRNGRRRDGPKFGPRTLDLDLLTYGDQVGDAGGKLLPRDEIIRYAFVLAPLADVAGDELHPELGLSYAALWQRWQEENPDPGMRCLGLPDWLPGI
jgi:2-amino-4-hydroxy-6-hydroxymethyldihydropteridine diphosphokinase